MAEQLHTKLRKGRTLFLTVLLPLLILLGIEGAFLVSTLELSGVISQLNQNARDIVGKQVENRRSYLENSMVGSWSDLNLLAERINITAWEMLETGEISLEGLDSSSEVCAPLLLDVVNDMVSALYAKRVSGVFVVFNTQDLTSLVDNGTGMAKTGLYIRDMDPSSAPSARQADLLLERAPIAVVRGLGISTNSSWQPMFTFEHSQYAGQYDFFSNPYQSAVQAKGVNDPTDYGYWSATPFRLSGSPHAAITYSIPLILPDGTVYGVLGIDLLTNYLSTMLPYDELVEDKQGTYVLAVSNPSENSYSVNLVNGPAKQYLAEGSSFILIPDARGNLSVTLDGRIYHAHAAPLQLYNSNTPFEQERWVVVGLTAQQQLYAFSAQVRFHLYMAIVCVLITGVLGSLLIGRSVANPVRKLAREVARAQERGEGVPQLSETGIFEIDHFSQALTLLSHEVVDSSTKFLRIMEMASVEIGGYELRHGEQRVFVTENFFQLFGQPEVDAKHMTAPAFTRRMQQIRNTLPHKDISPSNTLFQIPLPQGGVRYLRMESVEDHQRNIGLVEDVTASTKERMRIERERDYDLLTGLYSRRAFYRQTEELFNDPSQLKIAALLMLDLDNLKGLNDRFGHDWGDKYIRQAGRCFADGSPSGTLCARVSGDEFFLLFYGYESQDQVRQQLDLLIQAIQNSTFDLPNGEAFRISASGGLAWYPEDATEFSQLMRYSDFAMYQVKGQKKGNLGEFDLGTYNRQSYLNQVRCDFQQLLNEESLTYHFQPILDARTGIPAAYEALMRVENIPALSSPLEVLRVARAEGRLHDVERLTWLKSAQVYQGLLEQEAVRPQALLFVNSIANQSLSQQDQRILQEQYSQVLKRIVIEITEEDEMDEAALQIKQNMLGATGLFALDDYGSGYNSEKTLLTLAPKFIKVDNSIIRGIDTDLDKQQIVANIVQYAHARDMLIVAEGLETAQELWKVLELDVDLLQGYYLARPGAVPPEVSPVAMDLMMQFQKECPNPASE